MFDSPYARKRGILWDEDLDMKLAAIVCHGEVETGFFCRSQEFDG